MTNNLTYHLNHGNIIKSQLTTKAKKSPQLQLFTFKSTIQNKWHIIKLHYHVIKSQSNPNCAHYDSSAQTINKKINKTIIQIAALLFLF